MFQSLLSCPPLNSLRLIVVVVLEDPFHYVLFTLIPGVPFFILSKCNDDSDDEYNQM
jgi:hypothetical protein